MLGSEALQWETLIIPASMVGLALALNLMHTGKEACFFFKRTVATTGCPVSYPSGPV